MEHIGIGGKSIAHRGISKALGWKEASGPMSGVDFVKQKVVQFSTHLWLVY